MLEQKVHPVLVNGGRPATALHPQVPKRLPLRQSATAKQPAIAGRTYFMLLPIPTAVPKVGERVTLHAGDSDIMTSWSARALVAAMGRARGRSQAGAATVEPELRPAWGATGPHRYPVILRPRSSRPGARCAEAAVGRRRPQRGGRPARSAEGLQRADCRPAARRSCRRARPRRCSARHRQRDRCAPGAADIRELARADIATIRYDVGLLAPSRRLMATLPP